MRVRSKTPRPKARNPVTECDLFLDKERVANLKGRVECLKIFSNQDKK